MMIYWALATDENTNRQQIILGTSEEAVICNASNRNLHIVGNIDYTNYSDLLDFSIQETFDYLYKNEDISEVDERTLWAKATVMCGGGF
tara:strand:- start:272 stop:538 length:267 start_codon:yes stop_codon:yes gene_type:complete